MVLCFCVVPSQGVFVLLSRSEGGRWWFMRDGENDWEETKNNNNKIDELCIIVKIFGREKA